MSEKEIILKEIHSKGGQMLSYRKNLETIYKRENTPETFGFKIFKFTLYLFGYYFAFYLIFLIPVSFAETLLKGNTTGVNIVVILAFIVYLVCAISFHRWRKRVKKSKLDELKRQTYTIYNDLKKSGVNIPVKYWSNHALNRFTDYLTNLRADTLKECIQIYEQELMHNEKLNRLYQMDLKLSKIGTGIARLENTVSEINYGIEYYLGRRKR